MRDLAALSKARDILRLPETFQRGRSEHGLSARGKACAPESGRTEWLLRAVNPARDGLKVHGS